MGQDKEQVSPRNRVMSGVSPRDRRRLTPRDKPRGKPRLIPRGRGDPARGRVTPRDRVRSRVSPLGCLLDASLEKCFRHVLPTGGALSEHPEQDLGSDWMSYRR